MTRPHRVALRRPPNCVKSRFDPQILGYDDKIGKAREIIMGVAVGELGDSSVNLNVRPWVNSGDYWPVRADLLEGIKIKLDQAGISIPYPQQDMHMHEVKSVT